MMHRNPIATFILLTVGLALLFALNLQWGSVPISLHETLAILFHGNEVTAYCGPILFIGLAVPHLCRGILQTGSHRLLVPACLLTGALLALFCNLVARLPGYEGVLPVNSVTALVGAPVVVSVLIKRKRG